MFISQAKQGGSTSEHFKQIFMKTCLGAEAASVWIDDVWKPTIEKQYSFLLGRIQFTTCFTKFY